MVIKYKRLISQNEICTIAFRFSIHFGHFVRWNKKKENYLSLAFFSFSVSLHRDRSTAFLIEKSNATSSTKKLNYWKRLSVFLFLGFGTKNGYYKLTLKLNYRPIHFHSRIQTFRAAFFILNVWGYIFVVSHTSADGLSTAVAVAAAAINSVFHLFQFGHRHFFYSLLFLSLSMYSIASIHVPVCFVPFTIILIDKFNYFDWWTCA